VDLCLQLSDDEDQCGAMQRGVTAIDLDATEVNQAHCDLKGVSLTFHGTAANDSFTVFPNPPMNTKLQNLLRDENAPEYSTLIRGHATSRNVSQRRLPSSPFCVGPHTPSSTVMHHMEGFGPSPISVAPLGHPLSPDDFKSSVTNPNGISLAGSKFLRTRSEGCLRLRKRSLMSAISSPELLASPVQHLGPDTPCLVRKLTSAQNISEIHSESHVPSDSEPLQDPLLDTLPTSPWCLRPLKRTKTQCGEINGAMDCISPAYVETLPPLNPPPQVLENHLLVSTPGKSDSIRRVSPDVLSDLLDGAIPGIAGWTIIDCRFPFEFEGGHIEGAINVNSFEQLDEMFLSQPNSKLGYPIIFHCEFSSHRAPSMAMHLRAQDRILNMSRYPEVYYPDIYVLQGGYKAFFTHSPGKCCPQNYIRMDHPQHRDLCRKEVTKRKLSLERSKSASDCFKLALPRSRSYLSVIPSSPASPLVSSGSKEFPNQSKDEKH
jgi:rhodanese-related sulfurtransferase